MASSHVFSFKAFNRVPWALTRETKRDSLSSAKGFLGTMITKANGVILQFLI